MRKNERPIIIKHVKKGHGDEHHGGAWKVAYADFVTAMMAFFLLMWLLGATDDRQRKGLADYFSPTVPVSSASAGGDGVLGGDSVSEEDMLVRTGTGGIVETSKHGTSELEGAKEKAEAALLGKGGESLLDEEERRHVTVRLTDEGLVIDLAALPDRPLFFNEEPTEVLRRLVPAVGKVLAGERGRIAVAAHVPSEPVMVQAPQVWDLSMSRAERVRLMLPRAGIPGGRVARVTGHGDREPAEDDPFAAGNERVEVILLRRDR
jgi:chemotaxis protein MotB